MSSATAAEEDGVSPCSASLDPPANVVATQCDTGAPATPSMHIQSRVGDAATIADATSSEACASDAQQCKACTTKNKHGHHTCGKARSKPTLLRAPDRGSRRRSAAVQLVFEQPAAKVSRQSVSASTSRSSAHPDRDVGSGGLPRSHPLSSGVDDGNHFRDSACSLAGDRVSESVPIMNGRAGAQRMAHKHPMHPHQSGPVRSIHTCMYGHVCAQMICMIPMIPERPDAPLLARIHAS